MLATREANHEIRLCWLPGSQSQCGFWTTGMLHLNWAEIGGGPDSIIPIPYFVEYNIGLYGLTQFKLLPIFGGFYLVDPVVPWKPGGPGKETKLQAIGWMPPLKIWLLNSVLCHNTPGAPSHGFSVSVGPAEASCAFSGSQSPAQLLSSGSCPLVEKWLPRAAWEHKRACNRNNKLCWVSWVLPGDAMAKAGSNTINLTCWQRSCCSYCHHSASMGLSPLWELSGCLRILPREGFVAIPAHPQVCFAKVWPVE